MAFIPVPDCAEVVMTYTGPNGNQMKNVYNVRDASLSVWDPTSLQSLIDTFQAWETSLGRAQRSSEVALTDITARDLSAVDSFVVSEPMTIAGQQVTPALPANVTFAVKAITGLAGRSYRGRSYWIGLAEGTVGGDYVNLSVANLIQTALNSLRTTLIASLVAPVVVSRFTGGAPRVTGVATDVLLWAYVDRRVDTQRRRLVGEGT